MLFRRRLLRRLTSPRRRRYIASVIKRGDSSPGAEIHRATEKGKSSLFKDDQFYRISIAIIVLFVLGLVLKLARPILFPFFMAVLIFYIVDPVLNLLVKSRVPKTAAVILILAVTFILIYFLGTLFYASGKSFAAELPAYGKRLADISKSLETGIRGIPLKFKLSSFLETFDAQKIAGIILSALGPFLSFISKLLLIFLFLVFIVAGRGKALKKVRLAASPERAAQITGVLVAINAQIQRYLVIKTVMSLVNGLTVWLVLAAFHVDFAFIFGFLAFILNYVPSIGSVISAVLRVSFAFFQFGTIWVPLWILLITGSTDAILGNFVEPRIMGKGLGLSPLVVIFSLFSWGWLWGIPGMVLAVPLAAILRIICQNIPSLRPLAVMMGP
jgi:AI-2 transport protein TqsA